MDRSLPRASMSFLAVLALFVSLLAVNPLAAQADDLRIIGHSSASSTGDDWVHVAAPTGAQPGDLLVAVISARGNRDIESASDWSLIRRDNRSGHVTQSIWVRQVTAADSETHSWDAKTSRTKSGVILAVAGAADVDAQATSVGLAHNSHPIEVPSVTAADPGALLVGAFSLGSAGAVGVPTGMTEEEQIIGEGASVTVATERLSARGPTESRSATRSESTGAVGHLLVIAPSDSGSDEPPGHPGSDQDSSGEADPPAPDHPDDAIPVDPGDPDDPHDSEDHTDPTEQDHPAVPGPADGDVDRIVTGSHSGFTVPHGETWQIDGHVTTDANVVVNGTLKMRPSAHLQFIDIDMTQYVGAGGATHQPVVESDVGLWVTGHGVLDLAGTPKQGWNRTGWHDSWSEDDELWISPTDPGDYDPRPYSKGDPVPQAYPAVPAAEVMNVTRDVVIEGPAHIHVHSHKAQRIEYVELRSMGVSNEAHEGPVLGRYALHLHHGQDGTRGSIVRGVAAIDSRGRVFVPHESHGVTFEDVVSVNSYAEAFWWDKPDITTDVVVDGLAASGVHMPPEVAGSSRNFNVVALKSNRHRDDPDVGHAGAVIKNSAVSGSRGRARASGYHWNVDTTRDPAVWNFHNNVSHNNEGHGLRFWFNDKWPHHVRDSSIYNNGEVGIENGAYGNSVRYTNVQVLGNESGGIEHHSSSNEQYFDGGPTRYTNVTVIGPGPALEIGRLRATPKTAHEFLDCDFGQGGVLIDRKGDTRHPLRAVFRRCGDLTPDDFTFGADPISSGMDGSRIKIEHPDGREWVIKVDGGEFEVSGP